LNTRHFSSSTTRNADFTHAVIGAGAVGLAIARRLQQVEGASVVLIEKHGMVGTETSSRNSEVRHQYVALQFLAQYTEVRPGHSRWDLLRQRQSEDQALCSRQRDDV
jgi:glycine/D-amino acid oxidase-like deaminating enzyme